MRKIKKVKSSRISRGFFALKTSARLLPKILSKEVNPEDILYSLMGKDIENFVQEVGTLKGSFLKASQLLSSYGEYYFPKEINLILKKVQNQSLVLDWTKIRPLLSNDILNNFEIEENAIAAASIGQVHFAKQNNTNEEVVIKVQYPGVKKAINLDILILKKLLNLSKIIPKKIIMDDIYFEIKKVLEEEMDYSKEIRKQIEYKKWIESFEGYRVPKVYENNSNDQMIMSEFISHPTLSDIGKNELPQEMRDLLGLRLLKLYFLEVFKGDYIQTDCHPGNFHFDQDGNLYVIDFGACIKFDQSVIKNYQVLIKSLFFQDRDLFFKILKDINDKNESKMIFNENDIWDYCILTTESLRSDDYDWGKTDLPDRLLAKAKDLISSVSVEKPPHNFIFLDRKLLGVFSILRKFESRINMIELCNEFLKD